MVKDSIRAVQDDPLCIYCVVGEIRVRPTRAGQDRVTKELFRAGQALLHWLAGQSPDFYVGMEAVSGFLIGLFWEVGSSPCILVSHECGLVNKGARVCQAELF